ncbi:hypothetical protein [Bdellovibrio sp. HCB337]|uniref:hypothetical protein n=1 Tax=Bdellovibrio sp. HCB337 TaxID=3394358 RepID=UPI0039A6B699
MKKIILALTFFASVNAFAGAYSLSCSNPTGSVKIGKGCLTVNGKDYAYYSEYSSTRLMGLELVDFLKEPSPKVAVSAPDAPTNVAQGGVTVLSEKDFKDECGNSGTETEYKEAIGIYQADGSTLVDVAHITCTETIITGHCF